MALRYGDSPKTLSEQLQSLQTVVYQDKHQVITSFKKLE